MTVITFARRALSAVALGVLICSASLAMLAGPQPSWASSPRPPTCPHDWHPPVSPLRVVRSFDLSDPQQPWKPGHRGVDGAASIGQRVMAPADGVVRFSGRVGSRGVISVLHCANSNDAEQVVSSYEPVSSPLQVGAAVRAGQELGTIEPSPSHCPAQECLHWAVFTLTSRADNPLSQPLKRYEDPLGWLLPPLPAPRASSASLIPSDTSPSVSSATALQRSRRPTPANASDSTPLAMRASAPSPSRAVPLPSASPLTVARLSGDSPTTQITTASVSTTALISPPTPTQHLAVVTTKSHVHRWWWLVGAVLVGCLVSAVWGWRYHHDDSDE